jgi:flavin reductase (DIM6/NTAB) family NADH-FMN oxidoreductase RutF/rubredoxin
MNTEAFYKITYGLYVVSSGASGKMSGYIANTVFQVSSQPPLVAIACNKENYTSELITNSKTFSISVLKQDASAQIIGLFGYKSGNSVDKFASTEYITATTGAPIVTADTIAWFDCELVNQLDVGTHILYIGKIVDNKLLNVDDVPLTYDFYRNVKKGKAPKNAPTYIKPVSESKTNAISSLGPKYQCLVCDHIYDPEEGDAEGGIAPGTPFADIPDDWVCPVCGAAKEDFEIME